MQELTDDQLDGLFRKSAEEFDPPFDPAAWEALNDQLDERDRTAFWKKWLPWAVPLLLLLLMGGAWYGYRKVESTTGRPVVQSGNSDRVSLRGHPKQAQNEIGRSTDTKPFSRGPSNATASSTDTNIPSSPASGSVQERDKPFTRLNKSTDKLSRNTEENATEQAVAAYKEKAGSGSNPLVPPVVVSSGHRTQKESSLAKRLRKTAEKNSYTPGSTFVGQDGRGVAGIATAPDYSAKATRLSVQRRTKKQLDAASSMNLNGADNASTMDGNAVAPLVFPTIAELSIHPGNWSTLFKAMNRDVDYTRPVEPATATVPREPSLRGLSVRLAVSPDLTAIGLHNFSRPGTNVGMLLEYRIASRWSVQAGVIRSTKVYGATPDQYNVEMTWPKWNVQPEGVDGVCTMLDIPINVRFDLALRPRQDNRLPPSRWFVSGGVTSYVMLQEDYTYKYPPLTYNQPTQRSASTGGYGFSQANLSVGYERAISRRLSWQVEPFLKAPLKGVGLYKVNLLSTGAFLSLRYQL